MKSHVNKKVFGNDEVRISLTAGEIRKQFEEEYNSRANELFHAAESDIVPQLMAVCMLELNKEFGFGKGRLSKFYDGVNSLFMMMKSGGFLGQEFNAVNCIEYIKNTYGMDLEVKNDNR